MSARRVLLVGATGLVGGLALGHLLETPAASVAGVTTLVRRATGRKDARLDERVVDFDALPELGGHTDVLCALGTTRKKAGSDAAFRKIDHDLPLRVAEAAKRAGVTSFALVSSVGADARSGSLYLRTKGELEDALRALDFASLTLLRPSILLGDRQEERPAERLGIAVAKVTAGLFVGGLRRYRGIDADVVARALVATTLREELGVRVLEHDAIVALARSA